MSDKITIKTDRKWKKFKYRHEVPAHILERQFDYLTEDDETDGFFEYRECWYHTSEFMHVLKDMTPLEGWDGYKNDSFFSGVVIKLSRDGEEYQVGTFYS